MMMNQDSVTVDSAVVYEIPKIVHFDFDSAIEKMLFNTQNNVPEEYDVNLIEALFQSPYMFMDFGTGQLTELSRRGQDSKHTTVFLNSHRIDNPLFGSTNVILLPIQFIEEISLGGQHFGHNDVNVSTKINRYNKPYSSIKFMTGEFNTNMYNIDFTRPITNDFGFYLSGLYWESQGHRVNSHFNINSLYTNLYYNQILPMRFDVIYFSNEFGIPWHTLDAFHRAEDTFIDACWVCGNNEHKIALSYTSTNNQYIDTIAGSSHEHTVRNYGADINNYYNVDDFEIIYRFMGVLSKIESDFYGSHSLHFLNFLANISKSFKTFLFTLSNRGELNDDNEFFYVPKLSVGIKCLDSTYLFGTIARNYRIPSLAEMYGSYHSLGPYGWVRGNSELLPEYFWSQEYGIKGKNGAIILYRHDYEDLIILQSDSQEYYTPHNVDTWTTLGVEGFFEIPFRLNRDVSKSVTEVSTGFGGYYLFEGDSLPFIPEGNARASLSFKRETERFGLSFTIRGELVGSRHDMQGYTLDPFSVVSVIGKVRFITLSFTLRLDNISDENYAYIPPYTMEPRHLDFSVKWEFWD